jgi:hypothetical protein
MNQPRDSSGSSHRIHEPHINSDHVPFSISPPPKPPFIFPKRKEKNETIFLRSLHTIAVVPATLIILCSIENHHKKINSFFHTLLVLVLFSRDDRSFHAGNFAIHFSLGRFFFSFVGRRKNRAKERSEDQLMGSFFLMSLTRLVNRALIRFEKPKMLTI